MVRYNIIEMMKFYSLSCPNRGQFREETETHFRSEIFVNLSNYNFGKLFP
jgi:hypothetical protein